MAEHCGIRIQLATLSHCEQIISLDESVIGSRARAEQIRQAVNNGFVYVAKMEKDIVAFGLLNNHFYRNRFLELLIVKQEYRRKGLGRMLLGTLQQAYGMERLFTSTNASNLPMQRLLEACGFGRCGWIGQLDEDDPEIVYYFQPKNNACTELGPWSVGSSYVEIIPINWGQLGHMNTPNEPFLVVGRANAVFTDGKWTWTEEVFSTPYEKRYPDEQLDYSQYINNQDRAIFLAYLEHQCVGQVRISRIWNKYCLIEDISVSEDYRTKGIGRKLINAAIQWAKAGGMPGLMLETQDVNLTACKFYQRCGFLLGGVDTRLYGNLATKNEQALFWYMQFGP